MLCRSRLSPVLVSSGALFRIQLSRLLCFHSQGTIVQNHPKTHQKSHLNTHISPHVIHKLKSYCVVTYSDKQYSQIGCRLRIASLEDSVDIDGVPLFLVQGKFSNTWIDYTNHGVDITYQGKRLKCGKLLIGHVHFQLGFFLSDEFLLLPGRSRWLLLVF